MHYKFVKILIKNAKMPEKNSQPSKKKNLNVKNLTKSNF